MVGLGLSMRCSLRCTQTLSLAQQLELALPPRNWSLVNAFNEEGVQPVKWTKKKLDLSGMDLLTRLERIDEENAIFRYDYVKVDDEGRQGDDEREDHSKTTSPSYYRIPLIRNCNIDLEEIAEEVTKEEYNEAIKILEGAGDFQRIARAIPYAQLHRDVKNLMENFNYTLDNVVIVGVDRGGRLPSYVMREALGKKESYTLKVDQAAGFNGGLDVEKLVQLINSGVLQDKFVLFVDSTVDSGRQIKVLRKYFDDDHWIEKIGHKGWYVVGSNENGENLDDHLNINWGVDPDQTFEDNPLLMGVDYAPGSHTKVIECPTIQSRSIRSALLEVPAGIVLDIPVNAGAHLREQALEMYCDIISSDEWNEEVTLAKRSRRVTQDMTDLWTHQPDWYDTHQTLLVIGSSRSVDLYDDEIHFVAAALSEVYNCIGGTPNGNPGAILEAFRQNRSRSSTLYQLYGTHRTSQFGNRVQYRGSTKIECREAMVTEADQVLVIGGREGTLQELTFSALLDKPTHILVGYGSLGKFIDKTQWLAQRENVFFHHTLLNAVSELYASTF